MDNLSHQAIANVSENVQNFRYLGIAIGITAIVLGSIGNFLTIVVFTRTSKLQVSFNAFVVSLSVVDFLTASCMLPFNVAGYVQMQWPIGGAENFTSSIQAFVYFCCGYTSITCLMVITFNRFISIRHPTRYKSLFTKPRMVVAVILSWLIVPAFLLPVLVGTTDEGERIIGWNSGQLLCTFIHVGGAWKSYMMVLRVLFQFIPIPLMISAYIAMFLTIRHSHKDRDTTSQQLPWEVDKETLMVQSTGMNRAEAQITREIYVNEKRTTERRLLLVSATLCIVFILLFLPSLVINLLPGRAKLDPRIHMAASNMTWFNSCVNPFIYVIVNPKFRVEYKLIVKFMWLKLTRRI
uniref:G-protein coupled receptor 84-like n=1 Tax=Phallusia mammillata TaxID=59560 RepID=A0A6F9DEV3_9ASCI|nr:G-protein coupled receptor 84-like [Phallusia mammillata]